MSAAAPDYALMQRCAAGEAHAWRELHRAYHAQVVRFLRRLGLPPQEIEDATQEVFVQVFRYLAKFEGRADFTTWLYRICISQASRYRRSRVPWLIRWLVPELPVGALAAGPQFSESETARRVQFALAELKPAHRTALVLHEFEGLSGELIAEIVECPVATVWRRLHYARREFEKQINAGPVGEVGRKR